MSHGASVSLSPVRVALQRASVILPHQAILENFVHSNPLQNFQHFEYKQAIDYMGRLDDNMSPGERKALLTGTDLRKREKGAVMDLSAAFLDRGAAKWAPAMRDNGFLVFFARLESTGFAQWRFYARQVAAKVLLRLDEHIRGTTTTTTTTGRQDEHISNTGSGAMSIRDLVSVMAEELLEENLQHFGIPIQEWESCIIAMVLKLQGWAGMFHRMETHPEEAPDDVPVSLLEFCAVQMVIARSAIESVATNCGAWRKGVTPLQAWLKQLSPYRGSIVHYGTVCDISSIADDVGTDDEHDLRQN